MKTIPPTPVVLEVQQAAGSTDWVSLTVAVLGFIGSLAWPLAAILIVWWFREPIRARLGDVTSIDILGVKLQIEEAKEKAEEILGTSASSSGASSTTPLVPPWADDRFEQLANVDPRSAILYQWSLIEDRLHQAGYLAKMPFDRVTTGRIVEFLSASNQLSDEVIAVIRDLREIKNAIAHGLQSGLTRLDAVSFRDASRPVLRALDARIGELAK